MGFIRYSAAGVAGLGLVLASCATIRQVAALRQVDFSLDRVTETRLAGVDVTRLRSYEDLTATQVAMIGAAIARNQLPLEFRLHLHAENPPENTVSARLIRMEWTLLLENRETISGTLDQTYVLPPGEPTDIPILIRLDLLDFFERQLRDLVELALAVGGVGEPRNIALRAVPTIDTPVGPIRYPQPITIVSRTVGAASGS